MSREKVPLRNRPLSDSTETAYSDSVFSSSCGKLAGSPLARASFVSNIAKSRGLFVAEVEYDQVLTSTFIAKPPGKHPDASEGQARKEAEDQDNPS